MFFNTENPNRKHPKNTNKPQITKTRNITINKSNGNNKNQNIKKEKIIKIINNVNIDKEISESYNNNSYQNDNSNIKNHFFVRIYFSSNNDIYLAQQNNIIDFLLFIHGKIEKSFVLDSNNIQTFYSDSDNQVRIKIYYKDINIKRIFINTCSNLFSNVGFFLKNSNEFLDITENFQIDTIKITETNEKNILGIFENDTLVIPEIPLEEDIDIPDYEEENLEDEIKNEDLDDSSNVSINEYEDEDNEIHIVKKPKEIKPECEYDFVIIGGSPGGIMCAYTLAKKYLDKKILIIEESNKTLENYKNKNYSNTTKWWDASNDNNYKNTFTDIDNKVISQGKGLGGGSLHFGLQYIDHYDLIDLDYSEWHKEFIELANILQPQTYKYSVTEDNIYPSKPHFELLSELSKSKDINTYINKVYSDDLSNNSRILYGNLLNKVCNISVKYNTKIRKINFKNNHAKSCETYDGQHIYGAYIIISAGAIQTPVILQNSDIDCGNQIFDHCGITLLYDKVENETKMEIKDIVNGYSDEEIQNLNIPLLTINNVKELNTNNNMVAIINHTKLSDSEIIKASNGILPSYNINLDDLNSVKYIYDMGTYWLSNNGHPGGSLSKYLIDNDYDLTSTLIGRHGQAYNRLFNGRPSSKLIGVLSTKENISKEIKVPIEDIGLNKNNIIPHLQTQDINYKWQTYYSYLPNLNNKLIVTHAQSKNLPKTGYVKSSGKKDIPPSVKLDHLGNVKQRDLTLNYIYDAYLKNNTHLEKLGYVYNGSKITKNYIEKSINSIYHYHGTCPIGEVVNKNHKLIDKDNVYIADCSILSKPWPGSTSVPAAVAGIVTANKIAEYLNNPIFEWVNSNEYEGTTYNLVMECLNKWKSIITNIPTKKPIQFTFTLSEHLEEGVLGATSLDKYIIKNTLEIKKLDENNYYNDLQYRSMGEVFPYSGNIILNKKIWDSEMENANNSKPSIYYTLLHEIGHLLGIGPLWILDGALLYDNNSSTFFYGGENGNREYKKLFPNLNLSYMPIENDGGYGTAVVHPEEGNEPGASKDNRYFNGILHPGLDRELMTGWSEKGENSTNLPLSRVTIGMIEDLGYDVDYDEADPFTIKIKN